MTLCSGEESLKKNRKIWDFVPIWGPPPLPYFGIARSRFFWSLNNLKSQSKHFGKFLSSPNTTHSLPPRTVTVACISLDIRFICIKLSQIFTVTHVLRYGETKFVVSKKKGNSGQQFGFGSDPCPPYWDFVPNCSVFLK